MSKSNVIKGNFKQSIAHQKKIEAIKIVAEFLQREDIFSINENIFNDEFCSFSHANSAIDRFCSDKLFEKRVSGLIKKLEQGGILDV